MPNKKLNEKLKRTLILNSIFSSASGFILLIFGGTLSSTFALNNGFFLRIIGGVLIIFALQLRALASNSDHQEWMGWYASINDIFWVIGSIVILMIQISEITLIGNLTIGITAIVVGYFAYAQLKAIAQVDSYFELSREVETPAEVLWPIISDIDGFQKYAAGLSSTEIVSGNEEGMVRRCHDLKEQGWNETCVSWIEGEMYMMKVDTSDYPYPFHKFQGTWSVKNKKTDGSIITLRYDYLPKYGIIGKIMMNRMFSKIAKNTINDIFDNYEDEVKKCQILA